MSAPQAAEAPSELPSLSGSLSEKPSQSDEKGPAARRRPKAAGEAYLLYVEPAVEGANEADGPLSSLWLLPDSAVVHELDLPLDDLVAVLLVLHRGPLEIEVLGVDRLFVQGLVELRAQVLHPVVPLGAGPVVAQGLDVDDAAHVGGPRAVVLAPDDAALVVDDEGPPPERIDGRGLLGEEVVGAHVGRDDVQVVVEGARAALDLEDLVAGGGMGIGGAVDDLGAVERQRAGVLRVRALVGHHDAEAADLRVDHGPEGLEAVSY